MLIVNVYSGDDLTPISTDVALGDVVSQAELARATEALLRIGQYYVDGGCFVIKLSHKSLIRRKK